MSDVAMGKLLPNLKITLGNDSDQELMEDGELSDTADTSQNVTTDEIPKKSVDIVRSWMSTLQNPKVYENKNGGFVTGLDLSSEVLVKKLEERAERFGLEKKEVNQITQNEINALYKSLGIDIENLSSCKLKHNIRLDALHMRGVEEMNTSEIFKYFGDYGPSSVEWINDCSCNVVWLDESTTARALIGMSQPLSMEKKNVQDSLDTVHEEKKSLDKFAAAEVSDSDENENGDETIVSRIEVDKDVEMLSADEDNQEDDGESVKNAPGVNVPVPPGHWRVGIPHPKARTILLRFSTKDDKKLRGAEKRSHFYQKYGNPNYGGLKGIISASKKRKIQAAKNKEMIGKLSDSISLNATDKEGDSGLFSGKIAAKVNRVKMPRMKMYADDEEQRKHSSKVKRPPVKPLAGSIHSRLGTKYTKEDLFNLGNKFSSESDEESDDNVAINCTVPSRYNIWTDIAKSMSREDDPRDLEEQSDNEDRSSPPQGRRLSPLRRRRSSPQRRSERHDTFRTSVRQSFKSKRYSRSPPRSQTSPRDLRNILSSSRSRRRDTRAPRRQEDTRVSRQQKDTRVPRQQEDLRCRINRIKDEEPVRKHRSPLCVDD